MATKPNAAWSLIALALLACGPAPRAGDVGVNPDVAEVQETSADQMDQGLPPADGGLVDKGKDAAKADGSPDMGGDGACHDADVSVAPDAADSDTGPADTTYHLAPAQVPKGHNAFIVHSDMYEPVGPTQSRLAALPFHMSLLPDGQTLRVGLVWFNGYGAVVTVGLPQPLGRDPIACQDVVDGLLPSGLIYYDIDTTTDQVTFVGQVVLAPFSAEVMRWHWPLAMEVFGDLSQTGSLSSCTSTLDGFGTCLAVGTKEYFFPMCRHYSELDANYGSGPAACAGYPLLCGRGCNEHAADAEPSGPNEVGFVDPVGKALHSLVVRETATLAETSIPLPLAGDQIPREQAIRSACVLEEGSQAQEPYKCGGGTPYYLLYSGHTDDPLVTGCFCSWPGYGFSSLQEYLSNPDSCANPSSPIRLKLDATYFDPFQADEGAFVMVEPGTLVVWNAASEGKESEWASVYSTDSPWTGWLPSVDWYFCGADVTPFGLIYGAGRYVSTGDNTVEQGPYCFYWRTSLVEGSNAKTAFSVEEVGGQKVFRYMSLWESDLSLDEIMKTYGIDYPSVDQIACSWTRYGSVPLYEYPY